MYRPILPLLFVLVSVSAIDVPKQSAVRSRDLDESDSSSKVFRSMILKQLQQFDTSIQQMEFDHTGMVFEECIPCNNTSVTTTAAGRSGSSNDDDVAYDRSYHDYGNRVLALFPRLRENVKTAVQNSVPAAEEDEMGDFLTLMSSSSIVATQTNQTMGGFFDTLLSNPILLLGSIGLGLLIILPLAILEAISISTAIPILCILGFASSILFGACRRRLDVNGKDMRHLQTMKEFFTKYFDPATGDEIVPTDTTDVSSNLLEIIEFGLSSGIVGYLNNVTVASFLNDVATNENTSPLISTSIIAISPILMLQGISERTNTPIKCILGICDRRHHRQLVSAEEQCELDYITCQLKRTFMITA